MNRKMGFSMIAAVGILGFVLQGFHLLFMPKPVMKKQRPSGIGTIIDFEKSGYLQITP